MLIFYIHSFQQLQLTLKVENGAADFLFWWTNCIREIFLSKKTDVAIEELTCIREELKSFPPEKAVWDIDDLSKQPPWGKNISEEITDLSNYFVTSDGEDFISVFFTALKESKEMNAPLEITSL